MIRLRPATYLYLLFVFVLFSACADDKSYSKEERNRAIANIMFNIDSTEYYSQLDSLLANCSTKDSGVYSIGYFKFREITPVFFNNHLKKIQASGYTYATYDQLKDDLSMIEQVFTDKYGEPTKRFDDRSISNGESYPVADWSILGRTLLIGVFQENDQNGIYLSTWDLDYFFGPKHEKTEQDSIDSDMLKSNI